jgi:hypothetical protein
MTQNGTRKRKSSSSQRNPPVAECCPREAEVLDELHRDLNELWESDSVDINSLPFGVTALDGFGIF